MYLFSEDANTIENLTKHELTIQRLTSSTEVHVNTNMEGDGTFVIESTANHLCSFGIAIKTASDLKDSSEINRKKLVKLENALERLLDRTAPEGYRKNVSEINQRKDAEKVIFHNQ